MTSTRRAVVIGTGAGGLAAAAYLAKDGFDVLALEQADRIGGFLAPFEREGFQFDPGLHYIGMCRPGRLVYDVLAGIGIDPQALFCELDPDGFDVYRFPDLEIRMCRGADAYRDRLIALFPEDKEGLARLFEMGKGIQAAQDATFRLLRHRGCMRDLAALGKLVPWLPWMRRSLAELHEKMLLNYRARSILAAQGGDYGLPPSRVSAAAAWTVLMHYSDGAFFPRGGSGALRDVLVEATEKYGGKFRTNARVRQIVVKRGRVWGVELASKERIAADVVVSDVDPTVTFSELVGWEHLPVWLVRKVQRAEPSRASFTVFLGMRRDLRQHGLGRFNLWLYPTWDLEGSYAPNVERHLPRPGLFLSPNSLKDTSGKLAPAGSSTLEISTFVPFSLFAQWQAVPQGQRGADYQAVKESIADWMLREVDERCPGLIGDVVVREIATPLTQVDEVSAVQGGIYGPALRTDLWGPFRFRTTTPVRNLYLAGAGVWLNGVAAALASGRQAAFAARITLDRMGTAPSLAAA